MADSNVNGNSDEKLELLCDPCHSEGENNAAISFCEECNEYLCKHCNKAHRRLAATRDHIVKEGNDLPEKYPSKESSIDTLEKCFVHGSEAISHFCISHEEFCCSKCLPGRHKNCKDLVNAVECLSEGTVKEEENDLKMKMNGLTEDLNNTMYLIQKSHKAIEYYYDLAHSSMIKAKTDAIGHIEDIFNELDIQLSKTREDDLDIVLHYKAKCDVVSFDMKTIETYLKEKKKCSRHQMVSAMRNASVKIKSKRQELQEVKLTSQLNVKRYCFEPNSLITKLKTEPTSFGTINVKENVIKLAHPVNSLNAHDQDESDICCITGIAVLPETYVVVTDNKNASVKLIDTAQDKILSKVKLESAPWDVCALSMNQVALTIPDRKTVYFLSVSENTSLKKLHSKQIKLEGKCYGLTYDNDKIIVIVHVDKQPAKLEWYDLDGRLSFSVNAEAGNPQYLASYAYRMKFYTSDNKQHMRIKERSSVDAKLLDKLNNCRDEVTGMAIEKSGVLYYCDSYYHQVDCVYVDAKKGDKRGRYNLIGNIDPYPKCLAFCNETSRLFIGKNGNDIGVYIVI